VAGMTDVVTDVVKVTDVVGVVTAAEEVTDVEATQTVMNRDRLGDLAMKKKKTVEDEVVVEDVVVDEVVVEDDAEGNQTATNLNRLKGLVLVMTVKDEDLTLVEHSEMVAVALSLVMLMPKTVKDVEAILIAMNLEEPERLVMLMPKTVDEDVAGMTDVVTDVVKVTDVVGVVTAAVEVTDVEDAEVAAVAVAVATDAEVKDLEGIISRHPWLTTS